MNKIKKKYTSGHKGSDNNMSDVSLCEHCQRLCIDYDMIVDQCSNYVPVEEPEDDDE